MKTRSLFQVTIVSAILALLCSCGVGTSKPDDPFFELKDPRLETIQAKVKQVIEDTHEIKLALHPGLSTLQYAVLAVTAVCGTLVSVLQGVQDPAKSTSSTKSLRNAIVALGIISAVLSGGSIFLQKAVASQKELSNAVSAYEACTDTLFATIHDVVIEHGGFDDPKDLETLRNAFGEFSLKIIGVNAVFKDNAQIQRIGLE